MGIFSDAPAPFTDRTLSDQSGKVFIVTGATSGVGELLADILYSKNAKVYAAARSAEKAKQTIQSIQAKRPQSHGELVFLHLDLNDLTTIRASAEAFLSRESKLNVLWNNAGVMVPPQGSKSAQGFELQLGTNNLAPFLLTKLLTPVLKETAKSEPAGSVRVVWVASSAAAKFAPAHGVDMDNLTYTQDRGAWHKYGVSKAGNILHAAEYAQRHEKDNILSVSLDPGNLKTPLYTHLPNWQKFFVNFALKDPIYGAYTELFAGLSPEDTVEPFGKLGATRADIEESLKPKVQGGNGIAEAFYNWTEKQIAQFE